MQMLVVLWRLYKETPIKPVFFFCIALCFGSMFLAMSGLPYSRPVGISLGLFFVFLGMFRGLLEEIPYESKSLRFLVRSFQIAIITFFSLACVYVLALSIR